MTDQCAAGLSDQLLGLYLVEGVAGIRERLDEMCPGCVTDLVVGYVQEAADKAVDVFTDARITAQLEAEGLLCTCDTRAVDDPPCGFHHPR